MPNDALALFNDRHSTVKADWDERVNQYRRNYRALVARMQPGPYNSKIATKYVNTQIMVHTAFSVAGLLPGKPWVRGKANDPFREAEGMVTEEYNARLEELGFLRFLAKWYRVGAIYGTGIAKMGWSNEKVWMGQVSPANLAWDPAASDLRNDAEYVIERHNRQTARMLLLRARHGLYRADAVRTVLKAAGTERNVLSDFEKDRSGREVPSPIRLDRQIEVHDMTTRARIISVHVPTDTVLRDIPNPYESIRYYDLSPYPEVFQLQGYGIPELVDGINREKNTARQQRTDVRSMEANPFGTVRRGSGLNIKAMRIRPGSLYPVREHDDIKMQTMQDTGAPLLQEEMLLESEGDKLLGIFSHTRGERGAEMKATVANLLHTNVNVRFGGALKSVQDYPFRDFLADFVNLCGGYAEPVAIRQDEWDLTKQLAEAKLFRLQFEAEAHVGNPFAKAQILQQVFQTLGTFLDPIGQGMIARETLKLLEVRDYEDIAKHFVVPSALGQQQGKPGANQGQGVAQTGELARGRAATQAPASGGARA